MTTISEQRRSSGNRDRRPRVTGAGERRRSLAGLAILALTIAAMAGVLAVGLANAVM
jgi:hypothetical protein